MAALELAGRRGPRPSRRPLRTPAPQGRRVQGAGDSAACPRLGPPAPCAKPGSWEGPCRGYSHIGMAACTDQLGDARQVPEFPVPQFPRLGGWNELIPRAPGHGPAWGKHAPHSPGVSTGRGPPAGPPTRRTTPRPQGPRPQGPTRRTTPRRAPPRRPPTLPAGPHPQDHPPQGPPHSQAPPTPSRRAPPAPGRPSLQAAGITSGPEAVNFLITARCCSPKILTRRRNNGTNKIKIKKLIILCVCNLIKDAVKFYCFSR